MIMLLKGSNVDVEGAEKGIYVFMVALGVAIPV